MNVQQILNSKASNSVTTITPDMPLSEAAELLSKRRIGALVVSEDGKRVDGILSERDIVRELGRRGTACMEDKVNSVMTRDPICATLAEKSDDIFHKMTEGRFRHLPVIENGEMVGLISIGDVVKARLSELEMEKHALTGMIMGN
ncbi:MAG: CBS domain-containing protein [Pseudomonadota bacterium]